jgi:hypothetical protein
MADGTNGGPMTGLAGYLSEIDRQDDELDRLRSEYMNECKGPRSHIKDIMASAKEADVNMKAFRELLSRHRADRRHEKRIAALEADDQASYEEMEAALGDFGATPLGGAALAKAKAGEDSLNL